MPDLPIVIPDTAVAPKDYTLSGTQELALKTVRALIDGSGAATSFLPTLQLLDPNGHVMWEGATSDTVAAGASADVSWFQLGQAASSSGIRYDVNNVGDWLNVLTNGGANKGMVFTVNDAGGLTVTDNGGGGISLRETSSGGVALTDDGAGGISLNETSTGRIVVNAGAASAGTQLNDASTNGIGLQSTGSGGITIQSTSTGGIFILGSAAGVFMVGLPIVNPGGSGRLWNNGGVVSIT